MVTVRVNRNIAAPLERVFQTVANIGEFSGVLPHSVNIEYLTENKSGVGARFRETRKMGNREHINEFEVTEYVENERVRMVADTNGTVWDTIFQVSDSDGNTNLDVRMEARAHKLLAKLMNPLMKSVFRKGIEKDMDFVKNALEDRT